MNPTELIDEIWQRLAHAVDQRTQPWRTPVLASVDPVGLPQARTLILRRVIPEQQQLWFYTDRRSPKVSQLQACPQVSLLFWDAEAKWQLRVSAEARVLTEGEAVERVWQEIGDSRARHDYLSPDAPSAALAPDSAPLADHQLAIIRCEVREMDWLMLSSEGHRRARITGGGLEWLTP